jgi:hypothetical protein
MLKSDAGTTVYRATLLGREVVIKSWEVGAPWALLKAAFGASRAHRHWTGAQRLIALDIPTARPLAMARSRGALWLVMEALPGPSLLEELAHPSLSPRRQHALARNIARQLVALTLAGRYNRDHKPSNIIILDPETPDPCPAIIDTVAIRPLRPWRRADLYAMFAALVIEPTGCGHPPRRALMMRVLHEHQRELMRRIPNLLPDDPVVRRAARHADWMRITGLVLAHGDPSPKVNPLGGPPGGRV